MYVFQKLWREISVFFVILREERYTIMGLSEDEIFEFVIKFVRFCLRKNSKTLPEMEKNRISFFVLVSRSV